MSFNNYFSENSLHNDGFFIVSYPNEYANNLINSKSFLYLEKQSNIVIDHNDIGQIVLLKCSSITIKNQDLSNTDIGLELWDCNNCLVSGNLISNNNDYGIYIKGNENTITRNNIENNSCGLFWWGSSNIVEKNNIISNNCDASFHLKHKCGLTTKWKNNYWGRPMILPKIILGKKDVLLPSRFGDFIITIPWIGLDKLPAKIKKNIGG